MSMVLTEALRIINTETQITDTETFITVKLIGDGERVIFYNETIVQATPTDFTPAKSLIVAWLALGLYTPIGARTEKLSDYGLSNVEFMVSPDALLVAQAYFELTGLDITEAI